MNKGEITVNMIEAMVDRFRGMSAEERGKERQRIKMQEKWTNMEQLAIDMADKFDQLQPPTHPEPR